MGKQVMQPKITSKSLVGDVSKCEYGELYVIAGIARGYETKTSQYGDSIEFQGDIIAEITKEGDKKGDIIRAPRCYLPSTAENMLKDKLSAQGEESQGVEFKFTIGCKKDDSDNPNKGGYLYTVEVDINNEAEDRANSLLRDSGKKSPKKLDK